MKNFLRTLLSLGVVICLSLPITYAQSQSNYPNHTVKIVGPGAGSGTDLTARILAKALGSLWNQSVIIENRPGAGGTLGIASVVNSTPDGYTLLAQSATYVINPAVYKNLPFDVTKSLSEIDMIATSPYVLVTSTNQGFNHLMDMVNKAKSNPGQLTFSSAGVGSSTHLAAEYFNQTLGINALHVPFKSTPEALQEIIAGRVSFVMAPIETAFPLIKAGKLKALGLSSKSRSILAPEIVPIADQISKNFEINFWVGIWTPKATPNEVVKKLNEDIHQVLQDPNTLNAFKTAGIQVKTMGQEAFSKFVREEIARYKIIAEKAGIEPH